MAFLPVRVVELLRVEHPSARLTHDLSDDVAVAVIVLLVFVVALARRQNLAADLADRAARLLVSLLHVAVEQDLRAEHTRAKRALERLLAVCVAHVPRHLAAKLVRVATLFAFVHRRLSVAVDVPCEVLDPVAHERTVGTRVRGVVASTELVAHAVRLATRPTRVVNRVVVLLEVVGLSETRPAQLALVQLGLVLCTRKHIGLVSTVIHCTQTTCRIGICNKKKHSSIKYHKCGC